MPTTTIFAITWDYRCPFARNLHEHVVLALEGGAPWDVHFWPFSLHQVHVEAGAPSVWDDPERTADLLAMQAGIAVRDSWPEHFLAIHRGLFAARHDRGLDLRDESVVRRVLDEHAVDSDAVLEEVAGGAPLEACRKEHEAAVAEHQIFGVPTIVSGDRAVFLRVMDRAGGDVRRATDTVERVLDLIDGWPGLNELKQTTIPR